MQWNMERKLSSSQLDIDESCTDYISVVLEIFESLIIQGQDQNDNQVELNETEQPKTI